MPARGNAPEGDVLELREDGTVQIGWDGFRTILRRPKVGEWMSFIEEADLADAWLRQEDTPEAKPRTTSELAGPDGPFLTLYAHVISTLGQAVERADLPLWLIDGAVFRDVSGWWRSNPLHRAATAAILTTPSR